jgi:hypothetical protein
MTQIQSKKIKLSQDLEIKIPFYNRLKKIDVNWFKEGSDKFEDFDKYYNQLLIKKD